MTPFTRLINLIKHFKKEVFYIYGYAFFIGLISLSLPLGMQAIVNFIMMGQLSTSWIMLVIMLTVALILYSIFLISQVYIIESIRQKIFVSMAFEFIYRIPRFNKNSLINNSAPELTNRFFDVITIQKGLSKVLLDFSVNSLQIVVGLILLSFYHSFFLLFSLLVIAIIYFVFKYFAPKGLKSSIDESTYKYELAHWMQETARNMDVHKINTNTDIHIHKADLLIQKYLYHHNEHFNILKNQYVLIAILKTIIISAVLITGSILVVNNQLNLGQFIASEILIFMVLASVEKLVYALDTVYDVLTALEKTGKIMDWPIEKEKEKEKTNIPKDELLSVKFKNVTIAVNKDLIQRNLSFNFLPGDRIALCGHSGSGKSTLLNVLSTLMPAKGDISYNNIAIEQLNFHCIRERTAYVFHNPKIFEGTFIENISLSNTNYDIDRIHKVCSIVKLNEYIKSFSEGYNTWLSLQRNYIPKNIQLKIELARVIYKNPKMVLFDSDLHYLKDDEKKEIIKYFADELKDAIIVFNTTSLYTVNLCNKLIHLKNSESTFYEQIADALGNLQIKNLLN